MMSSTMDRAATPSSALFAPSIFRPELLAGKVAVVSGERMHGHAACVCACMHACICVLCFCMHIHVCLHGTVCCDAPCTHAWSLLPGGGTGIGKCIAAELLSLGATVVICSRKEDRLRAALHELQAGCVARPAAGGAGPERVLARVCNIRVEEEVTALFAFVLER